MTLSRGMNQFNRHICFTSEINSIAKPELITYQRINREATQLSKGIHIFNNERERKRIHDSDDALSRQSQCHNVN